MKILYLITKSEAGGAQTHVADLCCYFKSRGHEIVVMSAGEGWLKNECDKIGVAFVTNKYFSNSPNPFRIFFAIKEINDFIKNFQPDIVHCHSSAAAFLGRLAARGKVRTIYTAHGWGFNIGMNPFVRVGVLIAEKLAAKYTDTYICVAEFVRRLGLKYDLAPDTKFKVIHNGVVIPKINLEETRKANELTFSFLGRLAEPKRPELIIRAMAQLSNEVKNKIRLVIIGGGRKEKFLIHLAKQENINVDFLGSVSRKRALSELQKSDVFIFISAWEGFPYTILEAMSYGLPVIASDVGGVNEAVSGECGILVNNSIERIGAAIKELAENEDSRRKMGTAGREKVINDFSLAKMCQEVEKIYKKV